VLLAREKLALVSTSESTPTTDEQWASAVIGELRNEPRSDAAELGAAELLEIGKESARETLIRCRDGISAALPRVLCVGDDALHEYEIVGAPVDAPDGSDTLTALSIQQLFAAATALLQDVNAHVGALIIARPSAPEESKDDYEFAGADGTTYLMAVIAADTNDEAVEACAEIDVDHLQLGDWWDNPDPDEWATHVIREATKRDGQRRFQAHLSKTTIVGFQSVRPSKPDDLAARSHAESHKAAIEREMDELRAAADISPFMTFATDDTLYSSALEIPEARLARDQFCVLLASTLRDKGARAVALSLTCVARGGGVEAAYVTAIDAEDNEEAWQARIIRRNGRSPVLGKWQRVDMGGTFMFMLHVAVNNTAGIDTHIERHGVPPAFAHLQ
jgi:hypothetical protein